MSSTADDLAFLQTVNRHLRAFAEAQPDPEQRGRLLGIVAAIEDRIARARRAETQPISAVRRSSAA